MKNFFFITATSIGILSWILLFCLSFLLFFPVIAIKAIDRYALPSYSIDFSDLNNSGNILNQNFTFFDIHIVRNEQSILKIDELVLGASFEPQFFFRPIRINAINIKNGQLRYSDLSSSELSRNFFIDFNDEVLLSFKNFQYQRDDSTIGISGDLFRKSSSVFTGQLSFQHGDNLSTIAVDASENSYRFLLNLYPFKWFSLIPADSISPLKDLAFQMNAVGEFNNNQSFIQGSLDSNGLFLNSFSVKPNKGSFQFQSKKDNGTLKLTRFLHPFIDEAYPIQINLKKKSMTVPQFFLSPQTVELDSLKITNLTVENFFVSFEGVIPKFSGFIKDLDLKDLYFEEILNLSGDFSGYGNHLKFLINSETTLLKNHKKNFIPISISGLGTFIDLDFDLSGQIKNQSSEIDFALQANADPINPSYIELIGGNVTKEFIIFNLPESLGLVSSFIDKSILLGEQNSLHLKYSFPGKDLQADFQAKILANQSKLTLNENSSITLTGPIIEIDSKDLYLFSPFGKVNNFSYESAFGVLNYKTQKLNFFSAHAMKSIELMDALGVKDENFNLPSMHAEHKGEINLSNLKFNNAISVKTKKFSLPILKSDRINFSKASIYVIDLNKIYGLLPSTYQKEDALILLSGKGLTNSYDLTFSTKINLEPGKYIPDTRFLQLSGNDHFAIELNIKKFFLPTLKINSDLRNIELKSPLYSLTKDKIKILPTEILITNFSNPSLKLSNQMIDAHIKDFSKYEGYISIGKKLPKKFTNFNREPGLNIYFNSESISNNIFDSVFFEDTKFSSININNLAFDIKNFKFFNNNFSNLSGLLNINNLETKGNLIADKINLNFRMDQTGFIKIEINDSIIPNIEFIKSSESIADVNLNSRVIVKNSSFGKINIENLDVYLLNNKSNFTANNIKLDSNLISIKPLNKSIKAYFSINKAQPLYKLRGDFLIKDSNKIPYLRDFVDLSYFNGSVNLQWKELSSLSFMEGESDFILKDLVIKDPISDSLAINLLGVLNLRNILGKLANFDLTIDEFTSTKLSRVEGDLLFSKSKMRLASPLFIETNAAKMKWGGQINKNSQNNLNNLDLNLDLRVRIGENLPWYAALLGGLPAVAGSAVINEMFAEDIDDLTNFQYEILGTISKPKLQRVK